MKFHIGKILFLVILLASNVHAQFQGAIDMKMTFHDGDSTHSVFYSMLVRKDMIYAKLHSTSAEAEHGAFIFRSDKKLLWIINEDEKQYLEIPLSQTDSAASSNDDTRSSASSSKLHKTGKKQTLLGYPCDEWTMNSEGKTTTIWGTSKLGDLYEGLTKSFGEMSGLKGDGEQSWEKELAAKKVFPLKIVASKDGVVGETQEVTKIEKKTVLATMFEIPEGYTKQSLDVNMEELVKQLQEQMKKQSETPDSSDH